MSKLLGKKLIKEWELEPNDLCQAVYCRYVKKDGEFVFDIPLYDCTEKETMKSGGTKVIRRYRGKVRISERRILTFLRYSGKKEFTDREAGADYEFEKTTSEMISELAVLTGLCEDEVGNLAVALACKKVNEVSLGTVKKQLHLLKLHRVRTAVYEFGEMSEIGVLCGIEKSGRGRKKGSPNREKEMTEEEREGLKYNYEHRKEIAGRCAVYDRYEEFTWLEQDCCRYLGAEYSASETLKKWKKLKEDLKNGAPVL